MNEKNKLDIVSIRANALSDFQILYQNAKEENERLKTLLKKIYDRSFPSLFEDNNQTRLDPDLIPEIENALNIHR